MIFGLVAQAIVGFIMSGLYAKLTEHIAAFAVVYGIFLSLGEAGPGNNLGLLASKSGPTAVRGQYYGIAAAVGKVGAYVGTWGVPSHYRRVRGRYHDTWEHWAVLDQECAGVAVCCDHVVFREAVDGGRDG